MVNLERSHLIVFHERAIDSGLLEETSLKGVVLYEANLIFICDGANRIEDVFEKAAFLLTRITNDHPFVEGNKRTALLVAESILGLEGWTIEANPNVLNSIIRRVASGQMKQKKLCRWLRENTKKITDSKA